jgi:hypothetical protein
VIARDAGVFEFDVGGSTATNQGSLSRQGMRKTIDDDVGTTPSDGALNCLNGVTSLIDHLSIDAENAGGQGGIIRESDRDSAEGRVPLVSDVLEQGRAQLVAQGLVESRESLEIRIGQIDHKEIWDNRATGPHNHGSVIDFGLESGGNLNGLNVRLKSLRKSSMNQAVNPLFKPI